MFDCTLLRPTLLPPIVCVAGQFTVTQTFWQLMTQPLRGQFSLFPFLICPTVSNLPLKTHMIGTLNESYNLYSSLRFALQ